MRVELPDIRKAVYEFTLWAGVASDGSRLQGKDVFHGMQNRVALPAGTDEYAVIVHQGSAKQGTGFYKRDPGTGEDVSVLHWTADYQIVFHSGKFERAFERATAFETLGCSPEGCRFFKGYGMNVIDASGLRDVSAQIDADQWVYMVQTALKVEYGSAMPMGSEAAERLNVEAAPAEGRYFEDADAHHPPKE
jgi:hypothetical protein